jgi:hypothetical protein
MKEMATTISLRGKRFGMTITIGKFHVPLLFVRIPRILTGQSDQSENSYGMHLLQSQ